MRENAPAQSIFEKIWMTHLVRQPDDERDLTFVDRHVLQETTGAQAFERLGKEGRAVRYPALTIAAQDRVISTAPATPSKFPRRGRMP